MLATTGVLAEARVVTSDGHSRWVLRRGEALLRGLGVERGRARRLRGDRRAGLLHRPARRAQQHPGPRASPPDGRASGCRRSTCSLSPRPAARRASWRSWTRSAARRIRRVYDADGRPLGRRRWALSSRCSTRSRRAAVGRVGLRRGRCGRRREAIAARVPQASFPDVGLFLAAPLARAGPRAPRRGAGRARGVSAAALPAAGRTSGHRGREPGSSSRGRPRATSRPGARSRPHATRTPGRRSRSRRRSRRRLPAALVLDLVRCGRGDGICAYVRLPRRRRRDGDPGRGGRPGLAPARARAAPAAPGDGRGGARGSAPALLEVRAGERTRAGALRVARLRRAGPATRLLHRRRSRTRSSSSAAGRRIVESAARPRATVLVGGTGRSRAPDHARLKSNPRVSDRT